MSITYVDISNGSIWALYTCILCLIVFNSAINWFIKHFQNNHSRSTVQLGKRLILEDIAPVNVSFGGHTDSSIQTEPLISPQELQRIECAVAKALGWSRIYFKSGMLMKNFEDGQYTFSSADKHCRWIVVEVLIPIVDNSSDINNYDEELGKVYFLEPEEETVSLKRGSALVLSAGKENVRRITVKQDVLAMYFSAGGNFVPWVLNSSSNATNPQGLVPTRSVTCRPQ